MRRLPFRDADQVRAAVGEVARVIGAGGVVLLPTESFYGLGADPAQLAAITAVCTLKERPLDMGLPVLCADWQQLESLVAVPQRYRVKLSRMWPAALTAILPAVRSLPSTRSGTLAVRIPGHAGLRALLYRVGPLTATSANRHGQPPCQSVDAALQSLAGTPDLVLDGDLTPGGEPSTLVDLTGDEGLIVRSGACRWGDLASEDF